MSASRQGASRAGVRVARLTQSSARRALAGRARVLLGGASTFHASVHTHSRSETRARLSSRADLCRDARCTASAGLPYPHLGDLRTSSLDDPPTTQGKCRRLVDAPPLARLEVGGPPLPQHADDEPHQPTVAARRDGGMPSGPQGVGVARPVERMLLQNSLLAVDGCIDVVVDRRSDVV